MNLFAFGSNGSGQLGIGHEEDVSTPTQCLFTPSAKAEDENIKDEIIQIVAGGNHTLLLTRHGYVYAAGCNSDGRCGPDLSLKGQASNTGQWEENTSSVHTFRRVLLTDSMTESLVSKFKCISATWEGSTLVSETSDGTTEERVYVLGSSPKGELGLGSTTTTVQAGSSIPSFPPTGTQVSALASSMGHTVAVLSNGEVYGWGGARKGQLGEKSKSEKIIWAPAKIEIPFPAKGAVCGREFTVIYGEKERGELFVLGDQANRWGILDVKDTASLQEKIRERKRAREWSSRSNGQEQEQGNEDDNEASVDSSRASAGMWGFEDIGASWHGIYVQVRLASDARSAADESVLIAWGRNDRGQLPPVDLPSCEKIAVGSEHVLVLLRDGSVAAFGWGEHGNCGPETDHLGNVSGLHKVISVPDARDGGRVIGVGAGCATSWLIVG